MDSDHEAVLLCFGEVDIRANVIRQCYLKSISIEDCVNDIVTRYVLFASEIASHGFRILIYGGYGAGTDRNAIGSDKDRNYAAMYLNSCLDRECAQNGFVYFSLHDVLLDEKLCCTDSSFLVDGFHLHNNCLTSKLEIQTLLFDRAYRCAKSIFGKAKRKSKRSLVLANVGTTKPLRVGQLESSHLFWEDEIDWLESIVFDLGACIGFKKIVLNFHSDVEFSGLNLFIDGRLTDVNVIVESSLQCKLLPPPGVSLLAGRFLMLKASSGFLLSIKNFSVNEKSLI